MHKVCLFDLNGTVVDTRSLDPFFSRVFGSADARKTWFNSLLHQSLVLTTTETYADFSDIAEATLEMMAKDKGLSLSPDDLDQFEFALNSMPLFFDVLPALTRLKSAGYQLAVLTNINQALAEDLLSFDDTLGFFNHIFSTDAVRKFKPAAAAYHMAAEEMGVAPHQLWMVSAHAWDTTGAVLAGLKSALILRPGHGFTKFDKKPDVQGSNLLEVIEVMIHKDESLFAKVQDWI